MSKLKVRHYKNQLSSYEYWLSELTKVNDELKAIKRIVEEPKATQYGEQEITEHSDDQLFKYHGVLKKEEELLAKREEIEYNLMKCIYLLNSIDEEAAVLLYGMYVKGMRKDHLAMSNGYSVATMYRLIDRELEKHSA